MIRFDNVTKRFADGTNAVDDLSMEMPTGEITVLVGSSGCGKTTTLRMINRMVEPTEGVITIDDRDVTSLAAHELRRGIGYVIQQVGLFPHRTVIDNVTTVPEAARLGQAAVAPAGPASCSSWSGSPAAYGDRYPAQLSGGQQQRVGVARALAADPPVLLMDEPFGAVDPIVRAQLQQEFLRLQRELHKTIVFVTHDVDEAILLGDRIAVLTEGAHIEQLATPAELLAWPANDFVADFLGRDRGLKLLSLLPASEVPVDPVQDGQRLAAAHRREQAAPRLGRRSWHRTGAGPRDPPGDSARTLLDAAVSSPTGCAVRVDDDAAGRRAGRATSRSASCWPSGCSGRVIFAAPSWSGDQMSGNWDVLRYYTLDHLRITFLALGLGIVIAFPLALASYRWRKTYPPVLAVSNALYSIPSLALLVLLGSAFGEVLSDKPLIVTLAIYTLAILDAEHRRRAAVGARRGEGRRHRGGLHAAATAVHASSCRSPCPPSSPGSASPRCPP